MEYYNNINQLMNHKIEDNNNYWFILNQKENPYYFNDYNSIIFPTSIKIHITNYKNIKLSCSESKLDISNINSK